MANSKLGTLLGKPLAWVASFGGAALITLLFYLLGLIGLDEARVNPVLWVFVAGLVFKFVGWLVATYGPKPTTPAASYTSDELPGGDPVDGPSMSRRGTGKR